MAILSCPLSLCAPAGLRCGESNTGSAGCCAGDNDSGTAGAGCVRVNECVHMCAYERTRMQATRCVLVCPI